MPVDHIRYDLLTQQALRGVVRRVLTDAAKNGLPGEHHFYITFDTRVPNVRLSARMREQYPEEMTVVLQHQFWDLTVTDASFEVGLSFNGISEKLFVPFEAIKGFFDPSVQFGLQFQTVTEADDEANAAPAATGPAAPAKPKRGKSSEPALVETSKAPTKVEPEPAEAAEKPGDEPDKPSGGAEVVRLDRFRKK